MESGRQDTEELQWEPTLMMCPFCRHDETKVIDSRASQQFVIRRRRECLKCERRFTTYEKIQESPLKVIKKDGSRVPFEREKVRAGLEKACYKRPVSESQIEEIVCDVEADIYENFDREVPARYIGEKVCRALREIDQVAYVRFASVDFVEELEPMLKGAERGERRAESRTRSRPSGYRSPLGDRD